MISIFFREFKKLKGHIYLFIRDKLNKFVIRINCIGRKFISLLKKIISTPITYIINIVIIICILIFIIEFKKSMVIFNEFLIDNHELEKNKKNYNGKILSIHLFNKINKLYLELEKLKRKNIIDKKEKFNLMLTTSKESKNPLPSYTSKIDFKTFGYLPELSIKELSISLNSLLNYFKSSGYLKNFFNYKYYTVDGELTKYDNEKNPTLTIRIGGDLKEPYPDKFKGLRSIDKFAEFVLKRIDPISLANLFYFKQDFKKSIEILTEEIELREDYEVLAFKNRGDSYFAIYNYENAIEDYTTAINRKFDYAEAYLNRGRVYYLTRNINKAIEDYKIAIKYKPKYVDAFLFNGDAFSYLGNLYLYKIKDDVERKIEAKKSYGKAIYNYTKAIEIEKNCILAFINRGNAYFFKASICEDCDESYNDYVNAIKDYTKVINFKIGYEEVFYLRRGMAYKYIARYHERKTQLDNAIVNYIKAKKNFEIAISEKLYFAYEAELQLDKVVKRIEFIECLKNKK